MNEPLFGYGSAEQKQSPEQGVHSQCTNRLFHDETLNFIRPLRQKGIFMGFLSGLFHSRDKPTNSTNGNAYRFLFGGSNSGKAVNERSAMQMTAVYACVRILSESIAGLVILI